MGAFINNFFNSFFLNVVNLPTPELIMSEIKERLEGLKHHLDFGERGWWNTGGGDRYMFTMEKGVILQKCLTTFVPYCSSPSLWKEGGRHVKANTCIQILQTVCPTKMDMLIHQSNPLCPEQNRADADSRVLRNSLQVYRHCLLKCVQKEYWIFTFLAQTKFSDKNLWLPFYIAG